MKSEIEFFRILAAFGVVWCHSEISLGWDVFAGGLVYFVVVSTFFATVSTREHTVRDRALRLLVPCAVWAVFYGTMRWIANGHVFPDGTPVVSMILATPSIHLWFLPFIFFVTVAIDRFRPHLSREWVIASLAIGAMILLATASIWREFEYVDPFGQYAHALPAALIGVFLAKMPESRFGRPLLVGVSLAVLYVAVLRLPGVGLTYLAGLLPCYFLFHGKRTLDKDSLLFTISSATMGIYVFHVFVLLVLIRAGLEGIPLALLSFSLSALAIIAMKAVLPPRVMRFIA